MIADMHGRTIITHSVLEDECNALRIGGGIWYMHKLIIASSTTLQISATLLPVHPTGHMLRVHIFDVGEPNTSSYQQLTVWGANHIHVQYLSDMQTLFDTCNVHAQGIPCT